MNQQMILVNSHEAFKKEVNYLHSQGWVITPGSIILKETRTGLRWFGCLMERTQPAPAPSPPSESVTLDKLIVGFAAAFDAKAVQLQYDNETGHWSVHYKLNRSDNVFREIAWHGDDPYKAMALAITEVPGK